MISIINGVVYIRIWGEYSCRREFASARVRGGRYMLLTDWEGSRSGARRSGGLYATEDLLHRIRCD